jgi:hypothetical protein
VLLKLEGINEKCERLRRISQVLRNSSDELLRDCERLRLKSQVMARGIDNLPGAPDTASNGKGEAITSGQYKWGVSEETR